MAQGKKAKAAARPKTYALHEDEDGWEGIQEAQNAAATRALFQVTATTPPLPPPSLSLPPPQTPTLPHTCISYSIIPPCLHTNIASLWSFSHSHSMVWCSKLMVFCSLQKGKMCISC